MNNAIVLFAPPPLLGQAGTELLDHFPADKCLLLFHRYIEESVAYFSHHDSDFWLTCTELHQEMLLLQSFPTVAGIQVANGDMTKRLTDLTNYFLNYKEYQSVTFFLQSFTFLFTATQAKLAQAFRRTSRSVALLTDNDSDQLAAISVSFPFSELYQDIVWEKESLAQQIKSHCKDSDIPCRIIDSNALLISNPQIINGELQEQIQSNYPRLGKQLQGKPNL
ncbi:MAG: hypothetical protein HY817_04755 [Candidatus Abawacabacteria bacterium]|nr:hypothetical protein [Candidatus Abawacabacteria bacterium]